jgi:hypothetical protein
VAWKTWDVYRLSDGNRIGTTGGSTRQSALELASTLFGLAKGELVLVRKSAPRRSRRQ